MTTNEPFLEMRESRRIYLEVVRDPNSSATRKKLARIRWADAMRKAIHNGNHWRVIREPTPSVGMNASTLRHATGHHAAVSQKDDRTIIVDPSLPQPYVPMTTAHEIVEEVAQEQPKSEAMAHSLANDAEKVIFGDVSFGEEEEAVDALEGRREAETGVGWRSDPEGHFVHKSWDEARHPRDQFGRFASVDGGMSDYDWLKSSGAVRSLPDGMPKRFIGEVAKTMKNAMAEYPSLKIGDIRIVPGEDEVLGVRYGNLEVSEGLLDRLHAYDDANKFHATLTLERYEKFTEDQIAGYLKRNPFSPEAKNLNRSIQMIANGEADMPKNHYVASSIGDMLWHELGHIALTKSRNHAEKLVPGLDIGGSSYELLGDDDIKSAMKLSHYAAQAAEEYAAEAWCAYHTGRRELLDDKAKKLVDAMVSAASRHNLNT